MGQLGVWLTFELTQLVIFLSGDRRWSDRVGYVFRPFETKGNKGDNDGKKLLLAGYGIELQFKSTEYKAQDDSEQGKIKQTI